MNLSGKVLVITGSNGALGQAVAATLSRYGARLALLDHGQTPSAAPPAGALHYGGIDLTQADPAHSAVGRVGQEARPPGGFVHLLSRLHLREILMAEPAP